MRVFKYTVWIIMLFLVQTVFINDIRIGALRPDIILPFIVAVSIKEDSFKTATGITIACAFLAGALCGKNFAFAVIFYTYTAAVVFAMRRKPAHMIAFLRYVLWVIIAALLSESISYLILYMSFDWFLKAVILYILPSALYTLLAAIVIYPIINITLYPQGRGKKLLIVD